MIVHSPVDLGYDDLPTVTGDSGRVYSTPGGEYPSITTVLSILSKDAIQEWRQRVGEEEADKVGRRAAKRGTKIHDLMEKYIKGEEIDERKLMPHHRASFRKLKPIIDKYLSEVYAQEVPLYSDKLRVAGRVDLVGVMHGLKIILDFKTSGRVKTREEISGYFMQATAYAIMFEERTGMPIDHVVILMDVDNHDPIVFVEKKDKWIQPLLETIDAYYKQ